ncbi:MAG TPA: xanthine dehydrogenase molybdopterin binding subunit [Tenuifilaceae bacterium]|nr:xanthine dehydrogenase molybdopterin binding subunit [Bacteroidales bacterium]MDI9516619.1 xanthine dehydrogenase molybdopterin binding subunit [Bacteroidota bacterium]NLH57783.1 xanthine dehydrogenase molybdopterin binding subunit [Rikenellaceae bacterium]OQC61763.1 MAG: putative xanthine dehydrogenase subunit D [Bacteroidetes bacterium ADurb.Bin008]HNV80472.1 xanthine dehydrogenase molybdopterin binding subunit [Tenuifilaceae bacterium]
MTNNPHHESAIQHVTGEAVYVADMLPTGQTLRGRVVYSPHAHARIVSYDLSEALKVEGVHDILDCKRIPGDNQLSVVNLDELCLADGVVHCVGQAMFLIAAETDEIAFEAEKLIRVEYELLDPILTIDEAMARGNRLEPPRRIEIGNVDDALKRCKHVLSGELKTGAQEHWYLETQAAVCVPGEDGEMTVYASSQSPTETQMVVAGVLGLPAHKVVCEVRRMGGGFGGKETQGNHVAAWAALLANATRKPVLLSLFRDDDQKITGKRHPFQSIYTIGFDDEGRIEAYMVDLHADVGIAADLSMAVLERAMFHAENAYYIPNVRITGHTWKTNLPSNTAFRGFGGPQGMAVIENAMDRVARYLKMDAAQVRFKNFYGIETRNETPYGQMVENNRLFTIWERIIASGNYFERRKEVENYNRSHTLYKRGLALTPVKFGISFTTSFLNQAGALVLIYRDGTVLVNHGGTEMGQGLHTKIRQIAALELGVPLEWVRINATNTSKVPNTSPTAASSGTDLNGMAVKNAVDKLKERLSPCAKMMLNEVCGSQTEGDITFKDGQVFFTHEPTHRVGFVELVKRAYIERISLHATGYYSTPGIQFDKDRGKGTPFHYFAFGMAIAEVEVDTLTGRSKTLRVDIVHDVGDSINPQIDMGQVTGAFIQGMGWCTTETIKRGSSGELLNHSPDTYKIPGIGDTPEIFNVELLPLAPNPKAIRKSKAVGEPPFMLSFAVWLAIKDAISAVGNHEQEPDFQLPANCEVVLLSMEKLKGNG